MSILYTKKPIVLNVALAEAVGLNEAIVLQQLHYWLTNTRSGVEHDGRRWVFNTLESWQEQFPFWSTDTIKRAFTSLRKAGLIEVEQLAKHRHDRTNYYTIRYEHDALVDECKLPSSREAECPDLLPENTTEITSEIKPPCAPSAHDADPMPDLFDRFWKLYPNKKNKANARKAWAKLKVTDHLFDQIAAGLARYCASPDWVKDGGQFIPHPTTWLNGKRWEDEVALPTVNAHKSPGASRHSEFDDSDNDLSWMEQLRK